MSEEEVENSLWISVACSFAVLAAVSLSYKVLEPNGGVDWKIHAVYWAAAVCSISFIPHEITSYIFTELTVTLVGAVYPVYRATKAVCTPDEDDDKEWLQVRCLYTSHDEDSFHFTSNAQSAHAFAPILTVLDVGGSSLHVNKLGRRRHPGQ